MNWRDGAGNGREAASVRRPDRAQRAGFRGAGDADTRFRNFPSKNRVVVYSPASRLCAWRRASTSLNSLQKSAHHISTWKRGEEIWCALFRPEPEMFNHHHPVLAETDIGEIAMSATASHSCMIRVKAELHADDGEDFWTLTSDDLPGLLLGGRDLKALHADTPAVIQSLFKHNYGTEVNILPVAEAKNLAADVPPPKLALPETWAAIPIVA